jgi:hypothetical protein
MGFDGWRSLDRAEVGHLPGRAYPQYRRNWNRLEPRHHPRCKCGYSRLKVWVEADSTAPIAVPLSLQDFHCGRSRSRVRLPVSS